MPVLEEYLTTCLWDHLSPLLGSVPASGRGRPRVPERTIFNALLDVLVLGASYRQAATNSVSATTLRRRRDEWLRAGVGERLERLCRSEYHRVVGLRTTDIAVDGCITKAPCGGQTAGKSPVDRGKLGTKRSVAVDANGIPLAVVVARANNNDSPLLVPTLDMAALAVGPLRGANVHLDRGYESFATARRLKALGLTGVISHTYGGDPIRWVVERTNAWHNHFKKLARCTERTATAVRFYIALANAVITLRALLHWALPPKIWRQLERASR